MNKYIIVFVRPFIMGQHIYLYNDNGECEKSFVSNFDSAPEEIINIAYSYEIKEIHLRGNKFFTSKIRNNITNLTSYDKNKIEIILD